MLVEERADGFVVRGEVGRDIHQGVLTPTIMGPVGRRGPQGP